MVGEKFIEAIESNDFIWNRMLHLARKRNIYVYKTQFSSKLKGLFFHNHSYGIEAICLNSALGKYENFVMAHELGHAVLHKGQGSLITGYGLGNKDKVVRAEREADRFALKLINLLSRKCKHE